MGMDNFNSQQLSKHIHQLYFGGSWTTASLQSVLKDVTWKESTTKIKGVNTIATLVYHINYFVHEVGNVLEGQPLNSKDQLSFAHPPIRNAEEWESFLKGVWSDGKRFSRLINELPDEVLINDFVDAKYGSYFRNLLGILEHGHYHLGQIGIIKKLVCKAG